MRSEGAEVEGRKGGFLVPLRLVKVARFTVNS